METARRLGISLRRLDGWTPKRETVHHYDTGGRLTTSVEWVEPEWDAVQAGWMLALGMWEATRCPVCGGDRVECWANENQGRYRTPDPVRCHRETAMARQRKDYADQPGASALIYRAELRN